MQLYCKSIGDDLMVVAAHRDDQVVPDGAYGEGIVVVPYSGTLMEGDLVGKPAPTVDLGAYAAAKRYALETGGITVGDSSVATDRQSQSLINGAFNLVSVDPDMVVKFKTGNGFVDLDAAAIQIISTAVGHHVQACFAKEAEVVAAIQAKKPTITSMEQVDAAFAALS